MNSYQLKELFANLPDLNPKTKWDEHRLELRKTVANAKSFHDFLKWSTIQATMFIGAAPYIEPEFEVLERYKDEWLDPIKDKGFGKPDFLPYADFTSGTYVHQAYHIFKWMDVTKKHPSSVGSVLEIGAGYGVFSVIFTRMGFRGNYVFRDFPEMDLLRTYYLSNTLKIPSNSDNGVKTHHHLFVAICSLSEIPLDEREHLVKGVEANSYLIVYQPQWDGVNNTEWFKEFQTYRPEITWSEFPNPHFTNHWYLIGRTPGE